MNLLLPNRTGEIVIELQQWLREEKTDDLLDLGTSQRQES